MADMLLLGEKKPPPIFPIACIGGSAGSLPAYIDILRQMPAKSGMAFVIVFHRALDETGRLLTLLANVTHMEVVEVTDGMLLEPDRIFVAPPHTQIATDGVALRLAVSLAKYRGWPALISEFIFSLAIMCTSRAMAIIVSEMGYDGSGALAADKRRGGRTFAQSDACFLYMPQAGHESR